MTRRNIAVLAGVAACCAAVTAVASSLSMIACMAALALAAALVLQGKAPVHLDGSSLHVGRPALP